MKRFISMLLLSGLLMSVVQSSAQSASEKTEKWFNEGKWKHGVKLKAHESLNKEEFARQYNANPKLWESAFTYLRDTNFETLAPGKYPIVGDDLYVTVADGPTKEIEGAKWEAHRKFIDIQYIYRGKEKIGIHPVTATTAVVTPYNETKDVAFFDIKEGTYYISDPETMFIFFPEDGHRPSIKVEGHDTVKKIVLKVRAAAK